MKMATLSQPTRRPAIVLLALAYVGFISLGLPDGLLGVGWPSIRQTFGLPLDALGALLTTAAIGYLVSSFGSGWVLTRLSVGALLALSGLATATTLLVYALTPAWWLMVTVGLMGGLGAGAIDAGLNTYVATHHSARTLNWLHAAFGLGATLGPLVMITVLQNDLPWRWGYAMVGTAQLGLAACFVATRTWWETSSTAPEATPAPPAPAASTWSTLRLPAVWFGIVFFFVYTGVEVTAGQWAFTLFTTSRAVPPATVGVWISIYWGGLMVGRILFGIFVDVAPLRTLLRWSLGAIVFGALLVWLNIANIVSFLGLALMGLALAPVFPSVIATTPRRLGAAHAANGVGFQIAAAGLGAALLPAAVGVLADRISIEVVGPVLVVTSSALFVLHEALERRTTSR